MGSDGFESKKLGVPGPGGAAPQRLGTGDYPAGAGRDAAFDAMSGLGEATNLVEISGVVVVVRCIKGTYGFIVPDGQAQPDDASAHVTVLRRDGYQTAYEGARVVCECVQRAKGYQAFRIVSDGQVDPQSIGPDAAAAHPCDGHRDQRARARPGQVVQPPARLRLPDLRRGNARHLRSHGDAAPLQRAMEPGQYVLVRFAGFQGMMAAEIHPETGPSALSSH